MKTTISKTKEYYLTSLEQANTYVTNGQYTEAIAMLEPTVNFDISDIQSDIQGVISFCLGDIYRCCSGTENNMRAQEHLSRAIEQASAANDNQVVVAAKAALAQVETVLGNEEQAQRYRQEARDEFHALPEPAKWAELEERLEDSSVKKIQELLFMSDCGHCGGSPNKRLSGSSCKMCAFQNAF